MVSDFRKTFQVICKKNVFVIIMLVLLCPILAVSYSAFIKSTSGYRASEMYIGKLLYSIKVNGSIGNQTTIPANSEREVIVEVTSLNNVSSNYKLVYQNNANLVVKYANDDNDMISSGLITTTKTSTISVENNSSSSKTIIFNVMGGYATNELSDVIIDSGYTEIPNSYIKYDYKGIALYVDNASVDELDPDETYELDSYDCTNGVVPEWNNATKKITLNNATRQTTCSLNFKLFNGAWYQDPALENSSNYLITQMLTSETPYADNVSSPYVTAASGISFTAISSNTNGKGLYYTTDTEDTQDGSRVYYYRGNVDNNHVLFAGFCWRIIRTNEDGSIRMRYNGTPSNGICPERGATVQASYVKNGSTKVGHTIKFNDNGYGNQYVGYMYGNTCTDYATCHPSQENATVSSTIKTFVDEWYEYAIASNEDYDNMVATTSFCNDRSLVSGTGIGTSANETRYGAYARVQNGTPTYKCPQANDIFRLKAGLLTLDEVMYAGHVKNNSSNYYNTSSYLYTRTKYWLMSPYIATPSAKECVFGRDGNLLDENVYQYQYTYNGSTYPYYVLPVISLKGNVEITEGTGARERPWIV